MGFRKRWIDLLNSAATGTKKTRTLFTPAGVMIFGAFTAMSVSAAIIIDRLLNLPRLLPNGSRILVSNPIIDVGLSVTAWSVFHFLKMKGTPVLLKSPAKLVKTGPYRYVRNPMLTGVFLILFGVGVGFNSVSLVVFFAPLYVLINVWELKKIEEPELRRCLGDGYIAYRRQTPDVYTEEEADHNPASIAKAR